MVGGSKVPRVPPTVSNEYKIRSPGSLAPHKHICEATGTIRRLAYKNGHNHLEYHYSIQKCGVLTIHCKNNTH